MKNMLIIGIIFLCASCVQKEQPTYCTEVSRDCEFSKDYCMVKILSTNPESVDAFGSPLHEKEWYTFSTKSRALIPFHYDLAELDPYCLDHAGNNEGHIESLRLAKIQLDTITNWSAHSTNMDGGFKKIKVALLCVDGYFSAYMTPQGTFKVGYCTNTTALK